MNIGASAFNFLRNLAVCPQAVSLSTSGPMGGAPAASITGKQSGYAFRQRVIELVNKERTARGLRPVSERFGLTVVAEAHSSDMIRRGYFSHTGPDGSTPFSRMAKSGLSFFTGGENIAMGQPTPEAVVQTWMDSPGHRANILNPGYGSIGVGAVQNSRTGQIYWTQLFTN